MRVAVAFLLWAMVSKQETFRGLASLSTLLVHDTPEFQVVHPPLSPKAPHHHHRQRYACKTRRGADGRSSSRAVPLLPACLSVVQLPALEIVRLVFSFLLTPQPTPHLPAAALPVAQGLVLQTETLPANLGTLYWRLFKAKASEEEGGGASSNVSGWLNDILAALAFIGKHAYPRLSAVVADDKAMTALLQSLQVGREGGRALSGQGEEQQR